MKTDVQSPGEGWNWWTCEGGGMGLCFFIGKIHTSVVEECWDEDRADAVGLRDWWGEGGDGGVHSLSYVWLLVTPLTVACQACLSFSISQSLLKLMRTESMTRSHHLILRYPLLPLTSNNWSPDVKSWLIGKNPDVGKDWKQKMEVFLI